MFAGKNPSGACSWDWGPTAALANQLLYTFNAGGDSSIYRIAEGGTHPGTKLVAFSDIEYQLLLDLPVLSPRLTAHQLSVVIRQVHECCAAIPTTERIDEDAMQFVRR